MKSYRYKKNIAQLTALLNFYQSKKPKQGSKTSRTRCLQCVILLVEFNSEWGIENCQRLILQE